jgi:chemotaxis methyl-accepting protein methylase
MKFRIILRESKISNTIGRRKNIFSNCTERHVESHLRRRMRSTNLANEQKFAKGISKESEECETV